VTRSRFRIAAGPDQIRAGLIWTEERRKIFLKEAPLTIHSGYHCRAERTRIGLPLRSLSELTGISVSTLSAFELGAAMGLHSSMKDAIGDALERVDGIRRALLPAKLDLSDAAALREALAAHARGDAPWFAARAVAPKLPDALIITP
jgi:transcriptional regulator with XRE-family HTH domain